MLKELLENPQVTKSNQSQLIKVKSVQSFMVYLEPIWKFIENFSFCPLNYQKGFNLHVWLGPQYLHLWSWQ